MIYLPELYFFDKKDFPIEKPILVTAKKIGEWSTHYKAKLISPAKCARELERQGKLPQKPEEKGQFIDSLIEWIISNSEIHELFALFLDDSEIGESGDTFVKFDHHDDTCCWFLNLSEQQFQELKIAWRNNGLPEDLFYKKGNETRITKPNGLIERFLVRLGFTFEDSKIYSPKQWEEENQMRSKATVKSNPTPKKQNL